MTEPMNNIAPLARQYFSDLAADGRVDSDENLAGWLWFTCPANLRDQVRQVILRLREAAR